MKKLFERYNINIDIKRLKKNELQKKAVICYAENEDDEVLMLERIKEPFFGKLVAPGGKVEKNESIEQAAKREYFEETGVKLDNLELKLITVETGPEYYNWILFIFKSTIKKFTPKYCNEGVLKWIKKENLKKENLSNIDKKIIPYIFEKNGIFFIEIEYDKDKNDKILNIEKIKNFYEVDN
ncbi:hypothetical protein OSSY52_21190 [Tepiditoga spiralis]|uniref:Nudix hydrolase domain-containing protein n=1 Tax=Tepiditoga spiralis TaxID=2108365 RepID=A0A7G1G5Z7_9BACT|nr:NUDIX domain-containing protein [Tepiditoga spiralis]BBE31978.1 hypothetical protein OSSY52_21190 [Tepiditoga spiralis]